MPFIDLEISAPLVVSNCDVLVSAKLTDIVRYHREQVQKSRGALRASTRKFPLAR